MEVDVVGEGAQGIESFRHGPEFERRAKMNFAELEAVSLESTDDLVRFLELDGQMAGVVVHTQMPVQAWVARPLGTQRVEELPGLLAGLQETQRLRLQAEVKLLACAFA